MVSGELSAQPEMLVLARESRGMTQAQVATAMTKASPAGETTVSQGYVSRAEAGRLVVGEDRLELFATAFGYPPQLLCMDVRVGGMGVGLIHHRKRAALPATALRRLHAQLALARIQVSGLTAVARSLQESHRFVRVVLDDLTTPKDVARQVRRVWDLAPGPLPDMVAAIEGAGGVVLARDLGSDLLDAVSQWSGNDAPLVLVNDRGPGDRYRFSVAHELGHLAMHAEPGSGPAQEKQADAFAAEFLMPASDIRQEFARGVDLGRLAHLKQVWRVSMSALLRRALTLNAISEWQYRTLMVEMSALGYRKAEPVEIAREQPQRVSRAVRSLLDEDQLSLQEAAACAYLLPEDFQHLYVQGNHQPSSHTASKVRP